ncbi:hypothetical protein D3C86_1759490 [compost metagenome]
MLDIQDRDPIANHLGNLGHPNVRPGEPETQILSAKAFSQFHLPSSVLHLYVMYTCGICDGC